ncbi:MAG: hypothetical protein IKS42_00620 [Oscillospiraceae bacterium]|nr:hypothetical protein [Oscillospiraceae bacterium]MBR7092453.1 hypothetical protein [Clostridia bacterium]
MQEQPLETAVTTVVTAAADDLTEHDINKLVCAVILLVILLLLIIILSSPKKKAPAQCEYCSDGREIRCCRVEKRQKSFVMEHEFTEANYCPVCGRKLRNDEEE